MGFQTAAPALRLIEQRPYATGLRTCWLGQACSARLRKRQSQEVSTPRKFLPNAPSGGEDVDCFLICAKSVDAPPSPEATSSASSSTSSLGFRVRGDFPLLHQQVNDCPLVYLDNAATSQKPQVVLDKLRAYYSEDNANVHRGVHALSARATDAYEGARVKIASFINAESPSCCVYTRNATEAINVVAYSWGMSELREGDEIVLSVMEHHSNIIPWQIVAQRTGAVIRYVGLTEHQALDMDDLRRLVNDRTKLVSLAHVSNALGCISDAAEIATIAHSVGAKYLVDACQSVPHMPVDVQQLDCDWLVFSSHKMCGPTGIGVLYGKAAVMESMPPFMGGGEMIQDVFLDHFTCNTLPHKFEAGTPAIAEAIGLGAAVDYVSHLSMSNIHHYEAHLTQYLWDGLRNLPHDLHLYGPAPEVAGPFGRAPLAAFNVPNIHPNDICTLLDNAGVAIRAGHHCTQPLHRHLHIPASARASLHFYNTTDDIDRFLTALDDTISFFKEVS